MHSPKNAHGLSAPPSRADQRRPGNGLPATPKSADLLPTAAAANPSAVSPRLSSSRTAAARLGMRLLKRKSSSRVTSSEKA